MINFDFDYYRPSQLAEAYELYQTLKDQGKTVIYYAGGTEVITAFRKGTLSADAVIDLKAIDGMRQLIPGEAVTIGACCNLNDVALACPDLAKVFDQIADHTARNAITLGGNVCGRLPYKEAVLPLLAMEAQVVVYSEAGLETYDLKHVFDKRLKLKDGDVVYQFILKSRQIWSDRQTESVAVDYPLIHLLITKDHQGCFVGMSGYSAGPVYKFFNTLSEEDILNHFMPLARDSIKGSKAYKQALFKDGLIRGLKTLEVTND